MPQLVAATVAMETLRSWLLRRAGGVEAREAQLHVFAPR